MLNVEESIVSTPAPPPVAAGIPAAEDDATLLAQIRQGNDSAFDTLVERHHAAMIRVARGYVSAALAEEVAQEAWIAVLKGLQRFEGRSSFRTWLFRVVINRAISHTAQENRQSRVNRLRTAEAGEPLVEEWRFYADDHPSAGRWVVPPRPWTPEERLLSAETLERVEQEIAGLPLLQRQVITLRDVEGWTSDEVCDLCEITETHQRVLLHRARTRVRAALDDYLSKDRRP